MVSCSRKWSVEPHFISIGLCPMPTLHTADGDSRALEDDTP